MTVRIGHSSPTLLGCLHHVLLPIAPLYGQKWGPPRMTARGHPRMNSRESTQQGAGLPHMKGAPPASLSAWLWCPVTHTLVDMERLALQVGSASILGAGKCHCACSCPGLALRGPECSVRWDLASPSRQQEEATTS